MKKSKLYTLISVIVALIALIATITTLLAVMGKKKRHLTEDFDDNIYLDDDMQYTESDGEDFHEDEDEIDHVIDQTIDEDKA